MKDWDKLMKEYEGSSNILIADVDCTAGGKSKWLGFFGSEPWVMISQPGARHGLS